MVKVLAGDTIRGYDFKPMVGREDCFVEGVVNSINSKMGYAAYEITVTKEVFSGKIVTDHLVGQTVYVPVTVSFMEYAGRVINLSRI